MVVPPQLASFSPTEKIALQRARRLADVMDELGISTLRAVTTVSTGRPGEALLTVELQISSALVEVRILSTRLTVTRDDLDNEDLFKQPDEPIRLIDELRTVGKGTGAPISEGARDTHPSARGEGRRAR